RNARRNRTRCRFPACRPGRPGSARLTIRRRRLRSHRDYTAATSAYGTARPRRRHRFLLCLWDNPGVGISGDILVVFFGAITQRRAALFDQRLKFASHLFACRVRSLEILLQAVDVIDAGTDLRESTCIACMPPRTQEVSGGYEADRERDKNA